MIEEENVTQKYIPVFSSIAFQQYNITYGRQKINRIIGFVSNCMFYIIYTNDKLEDSKEALKFSYA